MLPREENKAAYKALLRSHIGPGLRERGFKGSGQRWEMPDPDFWLLVGFATSRRTVGDETEFGISLSTMARVTWAEAGLGATPSPNVEYLLGGRLVNLDQTGVPGNAPAWSITATSPLEAISGQVLELVDDHAAPWFRFARTAPPRSWPQNPAEERLVMDRWATFRAHEAQKAALGTKPRTSAET